MNLTYAIIGTGGIGGYYGGRLALSGKDVNFLFHSDYDYVLQHGLKVDSVKGNFILPNIKAYNNTLAMPKCDVVFVCFKTINNQILKTILPPILKEHSVVILIQNGLGMEENLSTDLPNVSVAGATAFVCTTKIGEGHINHAMYGELTLAKYCGDCEDILMQVCEDCIAANIPAKYAEDLKVIRWKKLVWNIPYNGLTVLLNATTEELTNNTESRKLIYDLMQEVVSASQCCGVEIYPTFVEKMLNSTEKMLPYSPSMKVDYDASRLMEIQTMYANPIDTARAAGFEMKMTQVLMYQLKFLQKNI